MDEKRRGGKKNEKAVKHRIEVEVQRDNLFLCKWNKFISNNGIVDVSKTLPKKADYFLDECGSIRFRDKEGNSYYVFIDDNDKPYHIPSDKVYCYKAGDGVIPVLSGGNDLLYAVTK